MPATDKVIGGPRDGEFIVPGASGMQRSPDARPIATQYQSPLADAARKEAQDRSYELRPVTFNFENGPPIAVYAPEDHSEDDVLRDLGLTQTQRFKRDREIVAAAVENI